MKGMKAMRGMMRAMKKKGPMKKKAAMKGIMKAKKKPLESLNPQELGVDISARLEVISVVEPPARSAGVKVESAAQLVDKLRNEAKVI